MTMLFQGVSSFFFTLATPFSLLFLLVGINGGTLPRKGRRNYLYEDILRLPGNAREFVLVYLLRIPKRNLPQTDPRQTYNLRNEVNLVSWQLTELFLREAMHMDKERIEEIRKLLISA